MLALLRVSREVHRCKCHGNALEIVRVIFLTKCTRYTRSEHIVQRVDKIICSGFSSLEITWK